MRADIDSAGVLKLAPMSLTEETMVNIWWKDKGKGSKKLKDFVEIGSFEEIGPACIKSIAETAETVDNMTNTAKKNLRKEIKTELDLMGVEYNPSASTKVLQIILEKVKAMRNTDASEKMPGDIVKPDPGLTVGPEPTPEPGPTTEPAPTTDPLGLDDDPEPEPKELITIEIVREAVKLFCTDEDKKKKEKKLDTAKKILTDHGATRVPDLKEDKYASFMEALKNAK